MHYRPLSLPTYRTGFALGVTLLLITGIATADSFSLIDGDEDGYVSDDEYYSHIREIDSFRRWDLNEDGVLEDNEWVDDHDYDYIGWDLDGDGSIDDQEFYSGTFNYYDADDDARWDETEWGEAEEAGLVNP